MKVIETELPGVIIIEPQVYGDDRGFFMETFHEERYKEAGIKETFVQDNHSRSGQNVLRGLHLQKTKPQGKLVRVTRGEVFDVAVDIDPSSQTFRRWVGVNLTEHNKRQFYIPPGYAHGFLTLSDEVDFQYKCTEFYYVQDEVGFMWDDPAFNIEWPNQNPLLSDKDKSYQYLSE